MTFWRKVDAPMASTKQRLVKDLFEFTYLVANGRGGEVQFVGGEGEAFESPSSFKCTKQYEVGDSSHWRAGQ
jgi:hypothetical protein